MSTKNKAIYFVLGAVALLALMGGAYAAGQRSIQSGAILPGNHASNAMVNSTPGTPIVGKITAVSNGKITVEAEDPLAPGTVHSTDIYVSTTTRIDKAPPPGEANPSTSSAIRLADLKVGDRVSAVPVVGAPASHLTALQITLIPASIEASSTVIVPNAGGSGAALPPVPMSTPTLPSAQ